MELIVLKQAERELRNLPKDILQDVLSLFDDLVNGKKLSFPISRPLPSIAKGLHELRLSNRAGEFRVFYIIKNGQAIFILLATSKKTQALNKRIKNIISIRIRNLNL